MRTSVAEGRHAGAKDARACFRFGAKGFDEPFGVAFRSRRDPGAPTCRGSSQRLATDCCSACRSSSDLSFGLSNICSRLQLGTRHARPTFLAPGISPRRHSSTTVLRGILSTAATSSGSRTSIPSSVARSLTTAPATIRPWRAEHGVSGVGLGYQPVLHESLDKDLEHELRHRSKVPSSCLHQSLSNGGRQPHRERRVLARDDHPRR